MNNQNPLFLMLEEFIEGIKKYTPVRATENYKIAGRLLFSSILSLSEGVVFSLKARQTHNACSLVCLLIEAIIQLKWMEQDYEKRGNDFYDFGWVEQLNSLDINPDWKDRIFVQIKRHHCERFLKKGKTDLLNRCSYVKNWYYPNNLEILSLDNSKSTNFQKLMQLDEKSDIIYKNYQAFCKFKHQSPFFLGVCFDADTSFTQKKNPELEQAAIELTLFCLTQACFVLNKNGENIQIPEQLSHDDVV